MNQKLLTILMIAVLLTAAVPGLEDTNEAPAREQAESSESSNKEESSNEKESETADGERTNQENTEAVEDAQPENTESEGEEESEEEDKTSDDEQNEKETPEDTEEITKEETSKETTDTGEEDNQETENSEEDEDTTQNKETTDARKESSEETDVEYIDLEDIIEDAFTRSLAEDNSTSKGTTQTRGKQEAESSQSQTEDTNANKKANTLITDPNTEEEEEESNTQESEEEEESEEKEITQIFYDEGEKVFEAQTSVELPEITVTETVEEGEKEIVVSSVEHVTTPLRIYTDLEYEVEQERIKAWWVNKNQEAPEVEYYDENDNGLIESLSFVAPHLSTQVFKIIIETETIEDLNATKIDIVEVEVPSGEIESNPIEFKFNVTYNNISNVNCTFRIDSIGIYESRDENTGFGVDINEDLQNADYDWTYICIDKTDPLNTSLYGTSGATFTVDEGWGISGVEDKVYLYEVWDLSLQETSSIQFTSEKPSNVTFYVDRPNGADTGNVVGTTTLNYEINETIVNGNGIFVIKASFDRLEDDYLLEKAFQVAQIDIDHPTSGDTGDEITLNLDIDSTGTNETIEYIRIDFGDGSSKNTDHFDFDNNDFNENIKHTYTSAGTYTITVEFEIDGEDYTASKDSITIESSEDNEDPKIDLIYPEDSSTISENIVTFIFNASDNSKVDSCNFSVYNVTNSGSGLTYNENTRVYTEERDNLGKDQEIEIALTDFNDREYAWEVECRDNSSNYDFEVNYFTYDSNHSSSDLTSQNTNTGETTDYERKGEVDELLEYANAFIDKEESWNADEKKALEDLGLLDQMKFYKKRLVDIEQTLSKNLNFIQDEGLREERRKETLAEIDEIQKNMISSFKVEDTYEYVKNGNTFVWTEIIQNYFDETGTIVSSSINALAEENKELQHSLSVSTSIKKVAISYYDGNNEKFMLVNKEIKTSTADATRFLEIIPKKLLDEDTNIEFVTNVENITKNHMYEFQKGDLQGGESIYKIHKELTFRDLEEIDTILFTDQTDRTGAFTQISGFLIFGGADGDNITTTIIIIILIIVAILVLLWVLAMIAKSRLKKNPNVYRILDLINEIKKFLKENRITDARENYKKIQEQYTVLDMKMKMKVYPLLQKAQIGIDKRDIFNLVTEYKNAKNNFQKEDATRIYADIQQVYKRLPKKDQTKVINGLGM